MVHLHFREAPTPHPDSACLEEEEREKEPCMPSSAQGVTTVDKAAAENNDVTPNLPGALDFND